MQCPNCSQVLTEQTRCQNCLWEGSVPEVATVAAEHGDEEEPVWDPSPVDADDEPPPQTADSDESPAEPELAEPAGQWTSQTPPPQIDQKIIGNTLKADGNLAIIASLNQDIVESHKEGFADASFQVAGDLLVFSERRESSKVEEEKPPEDFTRRLPPRTLSYYHPNPTDLGNHVDQLREARLLLIGCSFNHHAFDAAYEVIRRLAIDNPEQNRLCLFEEAKGKGLDFNIQTLLEQKPNVEGDSVVLVDASNTLARTFPDSILSSWARVASIQEDLRNSRIFLVVMVDLDYATQKDLKHQHLPYWRVPFLRPFLEKHFPDQHEQLETQIVNQRQAGRWEKDDMEFAEQVLSYYHGEKLASVIESGGPRDPKVLAESLLKESGQVKRAVLYTATFFEKITSPEFSRVVEALLVAHTARLESEANGVHHPDRTQEPSEPSLMRTWQKDKDDIFTELLLDASPGNDSVRVVSLSESNLREPLRRLFEKKHRFYLIDQFAAIQECGIFFYPSLRLAVNTTQIAAEMARLYPDEFNEGWIVGLVVRMRKNFAVPAGTLLAQRDTMFHFLDASQPGAVNLAFARVADICRRLLESPSQKTVVQNSLDQLMKLSHHEEVLWLVKQLRFSQDFDELYWVKQLLNRADVRTRNLAYYHLCSYLKRMRNDVHKALLRIETWLPRADREPKTYSKFEYFVFRLLIQYCLETLGRFDAKYCGQWPSRYPLFAVNDEDDAAEQMSLLARWLLHPGIEITLAEMNKGGTQMNLVGALLAEWSFILLGPNPTLNTTQPRPANGSSAAGVEAPPHPEYSATRLFDLLFGEFASRTDANQRLDLLKYWNRLSFDLLKLLNSLPSTSELRKELAWKRKRVSQLLSRLKKEPLTAKPRALREPVPERSPSPRPL